MDGMGGEEGKKRRTDETGEMLGAVDVADILILCVFLGIVPQLAEVHVLMALEAVPLVSTSVI